MSRALTFLSRRHGDRGRVRARVNAADVISYLYLAVGVIVMFGPIAWLVLSSFKTQASLLEFPPPSSRWRK